MDVIVEVIVEVKVGAAVAVSEAGSVKLNAGRDEPFLAGESFNVEKNGGEISTLLGPSWFLYLSKMALLGRLSKVGSGDC
jgi:hypothetical protein